MTTRLSNPNSNKCKRAKGIKNPRSSRRNCEYKSAFIGICPKCHKRHGQATQRSSDPKIIKEGVRRKLKNAEADKRDHGMD